MLGIGKKQLVRKKKASPGMGFPAELRKPPRKHPSGGSVLFIVPDLCRLCVERALLTSGHQKEGLLLFCNWASVTF